uniref:Putative short d7 salivary protein n=1 Tax=Psorophora albipes TaxID=869069 RepID=T1E2K6_9DIPT
MTSILLLCSICLFVYLSKQGEAASEFQTCTKKSYQPATDKEILCKITKLEVDANMKNMVKFITCGLTNLGYYNQEKKDLNADKVIQDMGNEKEVKEVIAECKTEFGTDITALDYLSCLLIDEKTKEAFKKVILSKDANFFKQSFC